MKHGGANILLVILLSLIIEIGLLYFLARPALGGAYLSWSELRRQREVLAELESRQDVLIKLDRRKEEISQLYTLSKDFLPERRDEGSFVIQLEAISDARATSLTTLAVLSAQTKSKGKESNQEDEVGNKRPSQTKETAKTEQKSVVTPVPVTFDAGGNFRAIVDVLRDLEGASRFSTIDTIDLARASEGAVNLKVNGNIYFKDKVTASADDPKNLVVDDTVKKALESLTVHGERINLPQESGFGRDDPFAPF